MPEGLLEIIALLSLGYVLLLFEIVVPGGILGILGLISIVYGCVLAFGLSTSWGLGAVILSVLVTGGAILGFVRSRTAKKMVLSGTGAKDWKAQEVGLEALLGKQGTALSTLRPAGLVEIDGRRVDVVADSEFIDRGALVQVSRVEGNRVVVDVVESVLSSGSSAEPA